MKKIQVKDLGRKTKMAYLMTETLMIKTLILAVISKENDFRVYFQF